MTTIQPQGENLRNAVRWISAARQDDPKAPVSKLIDQACIAFNLTPAEATYLEQFLKKESGINKNQ